MSVTQLGPTPNLPQVTGRTDADLRALNQTLYYELTRLRQRMSELYPKDGSEQLTGPLALQKLPGASFPAASAANAGTVLYNTTTGKAQISSGTSWVDMGADTTLFNGGGNRTINPRFYYSGRHTTSEATKTDNTYWANQWRYVGEASAACTARTTTVARDGCPFHGRIRFLGTTDKGGAWQPLEGLNVRDMRGKIATFAIELAVSNVRLGNIKMALCQFTGTEDSISGDPISSWGADGVNPTLATSWSYVNTPVNLGVTTSSLVYSVSGAISSSMNNLALFVWNDDKSYTASDSLFLGNAMLVDKPFAPVFEARPVQIDSMLGLRYLIITGPGLGAIGAGPLEFQFFCPLATPLRVLPSLARLGSGSVQVALPNIGTYNSTGSIFGPFAADNNLVFYMNGFTGNAGAGPGACTGNSESIVVSAEL